ncbi:MAG: hypothetical protein OSB69_00530 [Alphaproteobacteria bacterium]|nr:hypothetical protein [Alphaproteobacteria bacterium]
MRVHVDCPLLLPRYLLDFRTTTLSAADQAWIKDGVPIARAATQNRTMLSVTAGVRAPLDAGPYGATAELRLHQHQSSYQRSPVRTMYETQQWLGSNLTQHTARDYEIFQEQLDDGMSDYVCIPVELTNGIALHYGSVVHGKLGSGERLAFTVIGTDVNWARRSPINARISTIRC